MAKPTTTGGASPDTAPTPSIVSKQIQDALQEDGARNAAVIGAIIKDDMRKAFGPEIVPHGITGPELAEPQKLDPEFLKRAVKQMEENNDNLRIHFALEAFKIIVSKQVADEKMSPEIAGTWAFKFADAAMRAQKIISKPSVMAQGIRVVEPISVAPPEPSLEQVMTEAQPFNPANAMLAKS